MIRSLSLSLSVGVALMAGGDGPAFAQSDRVQVYSTAPRAAEAAAGGYPAPSIWVLPMQSPMPPTGAQWHDGMFRGQRPSSIQTAPDVVLGWGGLPPSGGQPPPLVSPPMHPHSLRR
jgi:hypothetical protein